MPLVWKKPLMENIQVLFGFETLPNKNTIWLFETKAAKFMEFSITGPISS